MSNEDITASAIRSPRYLIDDYRPSLPYIIHIQPTVTDISVEIYIIQGFSGQMFCRVLSGSVVKLSSGIEDYIQAYIYNI